MNQKNILVGVNVCLLTFTLGLGTISQILNSGIDTNVVQAAPAPVFNQNSFMTESAFRSTRAFPSVAAVQSVLDRYNSPLKNYSENGKSAAQIIFEAARGVTSSKYGITPDLNPGLLLAYLEKEQSLLSKTGYDTAADKEGRIRKAMGYGCPDGADCDPEYKGFSNQVNWAAYQLEYNYKLASGTKSHQFQVGKTIRTLDNYDVLLVNAATSAQYRYTPHVYWGNYNLWKIMTSNGWGDSAQTYSSGDIDSTNLPGKVVPNADNTPMEKIELSVAKPLLEKTYKDGEQSKEVETLQKFLKQTGHFVYPYITGYYGTVTKTAHQAYLRDNPPVIVNNPSPSAPTPQDRCQSLINKTWSIGQTSNEVKELQDCLTTSGHFKHVHGSTGYFGNVTQDALNRARSGSAPTVAIVTNPTFTARCQALVNEKWSIGEVSPQVKELQDCLTKSGHFNHVHGSTGYFGTVTQDALNRARGTSATPVVVNAKCTELKSAAKYWKVGTSSQSVRELQKCLQDEGLYKWQFGITGYFGDYTRGLLN